jgi:hypothetical protein
MNIIRRTRIAYWTPKATDTHSEYVIRIAFPLQKSLSDRYSMLPYTYTACLQPLDNDYFAKQYFLIVS